MIDLHQSIDKKFESMLSDTAETDELFRRATMEKTGLVFGIIWHRLILRIFLFECLFFRFWSRLPPLLFLIRFHDTDRQDRFFFLVYDYADTSLLMLPYLEQEKYRDNQDS